MIMRPFKIAAIASWGSLIVCFLVFVYIAISAPNTVLVNNAGDRDEKIREIRSSTDIGYLQERATMLILNGEFTSSLSMFLCRIALGTLLIAMICSGLILIQARKLRGQIHQGKSED